VMIAASPPFPETAFAPSGFSNPAFGGARPDAHLRLPALSRRTKKRTNLSDEGTGMEVSSVASRVEYLILGLTFYTNLRPNGALWHPTGTLLAYRTFRPSRGKHV
jgi:hypothetical protein